MTPLAPARLRTLLPLALVTGTSMLAMDLFLPAVPALQAGLHLDVATAQATVALFLAGLAASQLLWGEALTRWGPRRCVAVGVGGVALTSLGCALADSAVLLLSLRTLQGVAAGAAMVVVPAVLRSTLADADAVRGMAAIAMIEAIVPAAGPVLGALLLLFTDWRGTFWLLAAASLIALPWALRVSPRQLPGAGPHVAAGIGYGLLLRDRRYLRVALSHALCIGVLLGFVGSAPQWLQHQLGRGPGSFALLQVLGVAGFIALASQSGRISRRLGAGRAVRLGAALQVALCALLLALSLAGPPPFVAVLSIWGMYCAALAVRGPPGFSEALAVPPAQMGRATALLVLLMLLAGAATTQAVAPFLAGDAAWPLALAMLLPSLASLALVSPFPARAPAGAGA
jgi:DHA1 family bicyclomycin/chloramphenicol resistance-like MFS transporter